MRHRKLDLVKEATTFMVQQMCSTDRLSVVCFDQQVNICCTSLLVVLSLVCTVIQLVPSMLVTG